MTVRFGSCGLRYVLTGGQTGVDQAAWGAAVSAGLATGGAMPRGFMTEGGPRPEFGLIYNAKELESPRFDDRTIANVRAADATLVFRCSRSGCGTLLTIEAAEARGADTLLVIDSERLDDREIGRVVRWLAAGGFRALNVAGDRESVDPGVGARVERFLAAVFERLSGAESEGEGAEPK